MSSRVERIIEGKPLSIEAGRVARQADGAVLVRYGDTVVLVTVVASKQMRQGIDFFPLTVDYQERAYAAGKIPGGFFKREGKPHDKETLTSRLIDRPLRPLFPDGYRNDVQIIATVLSADQQNDPDVLAVLGASAALTIAPIPFLGPIGAVRVGRVEGKLLLNPTYAQMEGSDIDMVVAGTRSAVVMLEAGANEIPEDVMFEAIEFGHKGIQPMIDMVSELAQALRVEKVPFQVSPPDPQLRDRVSALARQGLRALAGIAEKEEHRSHRQQLFDEVMAAFSDEPDDRKGVVRGLFEAIEHDELRRMILEEGRRADGRSLEDVRPITAEVGVLPRTHGSALFTRGQTQALVTTTLGTSEDEQRLDDLEGEGTKRFMLHYNFPPFSVGEVRFMRGPGRREIGHGALAERALLAALPPKEEFSYTLRIVSDILESNGSSSMATVCGASLSLMDAGVPIRSAVAGVAMGLVVEDERAAILTDIIGLEDHLGDMDFKVAGTRKGITALQLDIKTQGIAPSLMPKALGQARRARLHILDQMDRALTEPRSNISVYAPRIITIMIPVDKIRDVIGPGGKVIRGIVADSGAKIDVSDDGRIEIASVDGEAAQKALSIISKIVEVPEVGKIYQGKVVKIMDFGAFVQILPGTDGLLHISQISEQRVKRVEDVLSEGEEIMVKVIDVDKNGKIRLSRKEVSQAEAQ
ncbi:MAG: polyribonucleotide nucleotidyltransferase [Candidatus Methylomirabilis oxygeniifera]|uniref:Polyribonucleotide nucleotidyltransferase n=1 Tax=Methylomirabilis oxygeniifera TaxID=671143 RepID=D5MKK9_METO1|nr:MAG: polyribonucleotide nucleotidyltransferase [Candidatus Methylomirabilis oxyfera]CBE67656.1 Polyribonucleotide nucleotidyltransferase (Polynucleotide phosphorylase) (PNPase) [Candidatus Methylomirabilis oxyfera]